MCVFVFAESACTLLWRRGVLHAVSSEGSWFSESEVPSGRWRQSYLWFIQASRVHICLSLDCFCVFDHLYYYNHPAINPTFVKFKMLHFC